MNDAETFLIVYSTVVPAMIVAIGVIAVWLHSRSIDREEARERAAKQPAE